MHKTSPYLFLSPALSGGGLLCKRPFSRYVTLFLSFVSLLLTSPYFHSLLEYSAHFCSLHLHHPFWPNLPKNVPNYSSNVTFY